MYKLIIFLIILFPIFSKADDSVETGLKYGVGAGRSADGGYTNTKFIEADRQYSLLGNFLIQNYSAGAWLDSNAWEGRKSSAFVGYSIGLETVTKGGFYAKAITGPSLLSSIDSYLGSHAQFHEDFGMGVKGENDISIGFNYSHFSDAGIFSGPNIGRDFLTFNVILPF